MSFKGGDNERHQRILGNNSAISETASTFAETKSMPVLVFTSAAATAVEATACGVTAAVEPPLRSVSALTSC